MTHALAIHNTPVFSDPAPDGFQVTATGLHVYGSPTFEQWLEKGEDLWYSKQAIQWAIGDWLNFGERAYGQKYTQAVDETRYTLQSLQNIAYTCNAILPEQRRTNVRFSNHSEVASLPEDEREYALDMLQSRQWTRENVREHKRKLKGDTGLPKREAITITPELIETRDGRFVYCFPETLPLTIFENPVTIYVVRSKPTVSSIRDGGDAGTGVAA